MTLELYGKLRRSDATSRAKRWRLDPSVSCLWTPHASRLLVISNTRTTLVTPPVERAISVASSASLVVTSPIRYTTLLSVTTLTWLAWNLFSVTNWVFTLLVM